MTDVKIPWGSLVLVCDGQNALLLRNEGDSDLLNLKPLETLSESHAPTHELGTDRPGRSFQSSAPSRSAMETTDFHTQEENLFLKKIAQIVDSSAKEREIKHLILVAPPRALGIIRDSLSPAARNIVSAAINKDIVHLPIGEIERHLAEA